MSLEIARQSSRPAPVRGLTIVAAIPAFNTEPYIAGVVTAARRHVSQVVVIDDGSSDSTAAAARAAGALVISHDRNRGYGEALRTACQWARANAVDILVTLDGDGQHDPDEIPRLIDLIINREADIVIGSRFLSPGRPAGRDNGYGGMPGYRRFGIRLVTRLFNLGSRLKISDSQSGLRAYNKSICQGLNPTETGMSISLEILEQARDMGAVIREVPTSCYYGPSRLSRHAFKHGLGLVLALYRMRLRRWLRRSKHARPAG
ncbi:MAG: glycosyltransferase family 2 protein [Chloroflexota bacterium]